MPLEKIRNNACNNMDRAIPQKIRNKLKLVSDSIVGNRYRAAWISYDHRECIICQIADYTQPQCPVELVPFGFKIVDL